MELYHLRTFVTVAAEGRLAGAAERLHTSVPAVSAHIKALEDELGVSLFTRTPKGMVLTEAGSALQPGAHAALDSAASFMQGARDLREELCGEARLGINTDSAFLRVLDICGELRRCHPNLDIQVLKSLSVNTPCMLRDRELDGGFVYGGCEAGDMICEQIAVAALRVAAPKDWGERLQNADWAEVASLPWIWVTEKCPFHESAQAQFEKHGYIPQVQLRTDDEDTLLDLVRAGHGVAVVREDEALAAAERGEAVLWKRVLEGIPVSFLYWRHRQQDRVVQALRRAVLNSWSP